MKALSSKNKKLITISAIFLLFLLPRTVSLGSDVANYDTRHWYPRMHNFVKAVKTGDWENTYQKYHPGVTLMWVSGFAEEVFETVAEIKLGRNLQYESKYFPLRHFIVKFPLVFLISILGTLCFWLIWKITNNLKYAFLFATFLSLEPFFLGISRFLHLSALTSMFGFASFLCLVAFRKLKQKKPLFFLSSILLGLSILTKVDGIVFGLANFIFLVTTHPKQVRLALPAGKPAYVVYLKQITGYILITLITMFVLWPALWVNPVGVVQHIWEEGFGGTAFSGTGGERLVPFHQLYYFEAFVLRSLPTTTILIPLAFVFLRGKKTKLKSVIKTTLIPLVIALVFLSLPNKTKDRYLVTFSPMLAILASFAFYKLLEKTSEHTKRLLVAGLVLMYTITFYRYHPSYSFYYNDLIGGPAGVERLGLTVKIRGEHYAPAALFLNKQTPEIHNRNVIFLDREQTISFAPFFQGQTYDLASAMPKSFQRANYFVVREKYLHRVPEVCQLIKEFGVRAPNPYTAVWVFDCGEEVDNSYKYD